MVDNQVYLVKTTKGSGLAMYTFISVIIKLYFGRIVRQWQSRYFCSLNLLQLAGTYISLRQYCFKSIGRLPVPGLCLLLAAWVICCCACTSSGKKHQFVIGFSQCVEGNWRDVMYREMQRELLFHPGVTIKYMQAGGNTDVQVRQVAELLNGHVDLLIVSPNEAEPLTPILEKAVNGGTPVVVVDRKINSLNYTAYVGGDNYDIGRMAGEYAVHLLNGRGNIVEITLLPGSSPAVDRHKGFYDALKAYPFIRLLRQYNGEWLKSKDYDKLDGLRSRDTAVDLVFAQNDFLAAGIHEYYQRIGKERMPIIVGVDGLAGPGEGMELVANKSIAGTMLYPTGGEEAIRTAVKILNNEPFKKENILQTTVIDSTNVRYMQLQATKMDSQQSSIERSQSMLLRLSTIYNNQRIFVFVLLALLISSLGLGGILLYFLRINRKNNRKLIWQNEEINRERARAEEAIEAKIRFFTQVSHEFRTPLTLILSPLEKLSESTRNPATRNTLELIRKNALRLLRMVNQLIDFRKIEVDRMKLQASENNMVIFLSEIVASFRQIAERKGIHLHFITASSSLLMRFDTTLMEKVIFNLLSNAIKFTGNNGYVHVYLNKTEEGKKAEIKIEDNGAGMSKEVVNNLFKEFYQGEQENSQGSGLGLALSKEFIELHNGTITVESTKGGGSVFTILLPLSNEQPGRDEQDIQEPALQGTPAVVVGKPAGEPSADISDTTDLPTVLLVEDNADLLHFVSESLSSQYQVIECVNGAAAIQTAFNIIPDLVISDVMMPGIDGLELSNTLKNDVRTSHIPIILLTARTSIDHQIQGFKTLAEAYITKPFNIQYLLEVARALLSNRNRLKDYFKSEMHTNLAGSTIGKLDRGFITRFTAFVEDNIANNELSVEDICKHLGTSRVQLYRKIKALLNVNVNDYILNTRLQTAKQLLDEDKLSIAEISQKVGFSTANYFSTVFKARFGVTPKSFREKIT